MAAAFERENVLGELELLRRAQSNAGRHLPHELEHRTASDLQIEQVAALLARGCPAAERVTRSATTDEQRLSLRLTCVVTRSTRGKTGSHQQRDEAHRAREDRPPHWAASRGAAAAAGSLARGCHPWLRQEKKWVTGRWRPGRRRRRRLARCRGQSCRDREQLLDVADPQTVTTGHAAPSPGMTWRTWRMGPAMRSVRP